MNANASGRAIFCAIFLAAAVLLYAPGCSSDDSDGGGKNDADAEENESAEFAEETEIETEAARDRFGFPLDHPVLSKKFLNIAHRGGARLAPEETMEAYVNANAAGADMLEMDLRASSDGVIVLHHDPAVSRVTDGTGYVSEKTYAELLTLDAGYKFTPDGGATYPFRGKGVKISKFRDVLEAFPQALFSIEIKQNDPPIIDAVLAILAETGMDERVILVSFYDSIVREIREKNPRIATGAGTSEMVAFSSLLPDDTDGYVPPCPIFQLSGAEEATFSLAKKLGVKVQIWTVNDAADMRKYVAMGADGIITDDPVTLKSVIAELRR